ncbi:MAG: tetratricopeptide repeat protein, partial [Bacteroidota bacterium]|nr:tetratricopeptide repeat protein [Bacteroidota bacterium]
MKYLKELTFIIIKYSLSSMKKNNYLNLSICILAYLLISTSVFSQSKQIDSLFIALKTAKGDTTKVNILNELSLELKNTGDYDTAFQYATSAKALAEKLSFQKGEAAAYHGIGIIYAKQGNYPDALKNCLVSLKIRKAIGDKQGIAKSYNYIGVIYFNQGNYSDAFKNYLASLKINETIGDKHGIAMSYNSIGNLYSKQGKYPDALKNFFASLKIFEAIANKKGIASSYNNIGNIYAKQDNYPDALKNFFASLKIIETIGDKQGIAVTYNNIGAIYNQQGNYLDALKNHFASLKIRETIGDKQGIAVSYNNIGNIYVQQGNYPDALKNYLASLKIKEAIGDKDGIAVCYLYLGITTGKLKNLTGAQKYLDEALLLSKQLGDKEVIRDTYKSLTSIDSSKGNYKGAYENHKLYILYRDSLDNEATRKNTIQSQMTFDFEKKTAVAEAEHKSEIEKQNAIAKEESSRQKVILISVFSSLLLVVCFAIYIFRSLRETRKQKDIIELQKDVVQHQKEVIEVHQKGIVDSINYAQRIQRALLASDKMLQKNLGDYFIFFKPKDIVSGDFYWAAELQNKQFAIVTADSTGHGVPGAIMSMLNIACLEKAVEVENVFRPAGILNHARVKIIETLKKDGSEEGGKDGMDCSLISFDFKNNQLTYAAANNPFWIVRGKEILEFAADKMPVGKHVKDSIPFTQHTIGLQKEDMIYVITDGMPDQFGGQNGKKFMRKQLKELLISIA